MALIKCSECGAEISDKATDESRYKRIKYPPFTLTVLTNVPAVLIIAGIFVCQNLI